MRDESDMAQEMLHACLCSRHVSALRLSRPLRLRLSIPRGGGWAHDWEAQRRRSSSTSPPPRLVVRTLENKSFEPNLETRYTNYLRHEFSSGSGAQIVPESEAADLVLSGQILSVSLPTLSFSQTTTLESRAEVVVIVKVEETRTTTSRMGTNGEGRLGVLRDARLAIQPRPAEPGLGTGRPFHRRGFGFPISAPVGIGTAGKADRASSIGQRGHHHQINRISTMASAISHAQLNAQLAQGTVAPLYAVVGEEDLLRDMALGALKTALLGEGESDFNCDLFYGDDVSGAEIVTCASEVAVFAARRVVVVKAADKLPARECDAILPYLKEPNDSTAVIFVASKLDGRLKFTQALAKAAVTVDCSPLREAQWLPWLRQDAERVGVRLNEEAIELLKEVCGGSLYSVRRELEKLAAYVSPGQAVTADDVATLRGTEPGASVFDLTLAIGEKNRGRVLAILARNLEAGEAPLRILGSLAWQYRRLWKVKEVVRQGGREGEAARTLRMDPYKVRAFLDQFPDAHLHEALRLFLDADAKLKGGSGGRPARILEDRVVAVMRSRPVQCACHPHRVVAPRCRNR